MTQIVVEGYGQFRKRACQEKIPIHFAGYPTFSTAFGERMGDRRGVFCSAATPARRAKLISRLMGHAASSESVCR